MRQFWRLCVYLLISHCMKKIRSRFVLGVIKSLQFQEKKGKEKKRKGESVDWDKIKKLPMQAASLFFPSWVIARKYTIFDT